MELILDVFSFLVCLVIVDSAGSIQLYVENNNEIIWD